MPLDSSTLAYIGIGSNLNQPLQQVKAALRTLATLADCKLLSHSSLYASYAVGPGEQDNYINAVAAIKTTRSAEQLLTQLQTIEAAHGRIRKQRWEPRPLDLDILLFGEQTINNHRLTVPHPEMTKRHFVLYPLAEIAPQLVLPDGTLLDNLLSQCPSEELSIVESAKAVMNSETEGTQQ